ncbi:exostosin domain-containing protein [Winogradskyella thalassocola]|uniref:Exostosin family protein n=1 Tax=Winogradskyella thalassocola TaxID=262004 RepID=A0A1G8FZK2_9FLAO|nr:exostosin family protein [Winogradskyella thalassocola]SDH87510.1 Exostosin family protein [Winogradskyella thalassocola]
MTFYFPKRHYDKSFRGQTFPLLKPFLKGEDFSDEERKAMYSISKEDVAFVDVLEASDVAILTMSWNYYVKTKQQSKALQFIKATQRLNITTWVVLLDDVGIDFPDFPHVKLFRQSGYRSRVPKWHIGLPVFISDPLKVQYNKGTIFERPYTKNPTIGFCGFATSKVVLAIKTKFKIGLKNLSYYLKLSSQEPEAIMAAALWRHSILKRMENHQGLITNFIYRAKYRAGSQNETQRATSTAEFFNNIKDSDYVVCVRGAGNFSVRLYETLAMGRIPVFVNTDCILPYTEAIDWKQHVVWVESYEVHKIGAIVYEFHKALSEDNFVQLQQRNRCLWENKLQLKGLL